MNEAERTKDLSDYLYAIRRRRTPILIIAATLFVISVLVAFLLPPVYSSTATILIEEQEIPTEMIRSTITTYAWQRIQTISQRVMTRANLLEIVNKYDLYANKRKWETTEEITERMRKDVKMDPISADVIDPRTGQPRPATIAFTLGYEGQDAQITQKVASELTTLYLNENLKSRTEKSAETYDFLTDEAKKLADHIAELESKLAAFKQKNINSLPELAQLNLSLMDRTEQELRDTQNQIRTAEERKFYIEGQLAQMSPNSPMFSATGERILDSETRLKVLRTELAAATAKYSPEHPDILKMRGEIEGLEKQTSGVSQRQQQAKEMTRLRSELAASREKYSEEHPDVVRLTKQLAALEASLSGTAGKTPESAVAAEKPENPAYIALSSQLEGTNSEIRSLYTKRDQVKAKMADYEKRIVQTPQVEREYLDLKRDYENSQLRYRELKSKQMDADAGQQMEKERKGEKFSLIDPPQLPERPVRPNRKAILLLGLILSLGGGLGFALTADSLDSSVRGARGVMFALGAAPLAVIPYIENSDDADRRNKTKRLALRTTVAGLVVVVVLVQFLWLPLDVIWYKGTRILGTFIGG
jgi:polysaccharide biosynthesis transport protein